MALLMKSPCPSPNSDSAKKKNVIFIVIVNYSALNGADGLCDEILAHPGSSYTENEENFIVIVIFIANKLEFLNWGKRHCDCYCEPRVMLLLISMI